MKSSGKLRRGEMPPLEEEQPPEEQRQAVAAWLARELERIDATTPPDPGRVTARRLNRTEYNNTIKELLGVDIRPADDFPQDDAGYGFDNIADVLSLSPVLMEKYVSAADRVARVALFGPPPMEPTLIRGCARRAARSSRRARFPPSYDVTGLSLPNAFHAMHRIPVDGEYIVRVVLGGLRPKSIGAGDRGAVGGRKANPDSRRTIRRTPRRSRRSAGLRRPGRSDEDQDDGRRSLDLGRHPAHLRRTAGALRRTEPVDAPRAAGASSSRRANAPPERLEQLRKRFDDAKAELAKIPFNGVRVNAVEIGGPYSYREGAVAREPRKGLHLRPPRRPAPAHVHAADHDRPRAARIPAPGHDARGREVHRPRRVGAEGGSARSKKGWRSASRRFWSRPTSCSASSAIARGTAAARRVPDHAARAGDAPVVLPLGEHARRRAAARGGRRHAARPADPRVPGAAHAPRSEGPRARRELRRAVAAVPRARVADARSRQVPRLRRLPPALDAPGDRALRRDDHPRTIAACSTSSTGATRS